MVARGCVCGALVLWLVGCAESGADVPVDPGGGFGPQGESPMGGAGDTAGDDSSAGSPSMPGDPASDGGDGPSMQGGDGNAGDGSTPSAGSGAAGSGDPVSGGDGDGDTAAGTRPLTRADGFVSVAPPLGTPLPDGAADVWHEETLSGTTCRDGSPMKIFYRYSDDTSNYVIFLEGGGVCFDDFFCPLNPKNVNERVDGESIIAAALGNLGGAAQIPQEPRDEGIFKNDPSNPLALWNAVYVPYCSGDVYGGTRSGVSVPRWPAGTPQEFNGYENTEIMLGRVVATFQDADKALLTGSSAGGVGALLHGGPFADMLADYTDTRGFVVSDSGPVFDDPFLETCIQKEWRDLWGLDDAFPADCEGCYEADGGGIARGVGEYLFQKFPGSDQVLGGLISTVDDEIMKLFFGKGLDNCVGNPFYPLGRYQQGLDDFAKNVVDDSRFGTYFMLGSLHMHLTNPRYYQTNGVTMSIAEWLGQVLDNQAPHVGP